MHQAILAHSPQYPAILSDATPRLLRVLVPRFVAIYQQPTTVHSMAPVALAVNTISIFLRLLVEQDGIVPITKWIADLKEDLQAPGYNEEDLLEVLRTLLESSGLFDMTEGAQAAILHPEWAERITLDHGHLKTLTTREDTQSSTN